MEIRYKLPQVKPEIVAELETQHNLGDLMLRNVTEAFASGDYAAAGYASEIYDETREIASKLTAEAVSDLSRQEAALAHGLPLESPWSVITTEIGRKLHGKLNLLGTIRQPAEIDLGEDLEKETYINEFPKKTIKPLLNDSLITAKAPEFYSEKINLS